MRFVFFLLMLMMSGELCLAAPTQGDLKKIQAQIKEEQQNHAALQQKAKDVAREVSSVQQQMIKAANDVQDFEDTLSRLEKNLQDLQEQQQLVQERLNLRQGQLVQLMSGLQKLALNPPETALFQPRSPVDNLRSSLLLKEARKPLQATAERLKQDLNMLGTLQAAIRAQAIQIKVASAQLAEEKEKMERLVKQKFILQAHFEGESLEAKKKAEQLGQQAQDLQDLLAKLDKERKRQEQIQKIAQAAHKQKPILSVPTIPRVKGAFEKSLGSLPLPARGRIVEGYGQPLPSGMKTKGITMQTRPGAQVIAPFDGVVLFAGPFKGYGNLLIIEHGDGYHSLLSGLERLDVGVGQNVLTGEPVGIMSTEGPQKLYIEFRKEGQPVNPGSWFASKKK